MGIVSLVSRPFVAIKKLTQNQKDGKNGEGRIHHLMISDGLEVNAVWGGWGGGEQLQNNPLDHLFEQF